MQKELAGEPELQADMLTMMGRTYRRLGAYDKAQPLLEQALASGQKAFGPEHVRVAQTLHDLGVVLADKGDYAAPRPDARTGARDATEAPRRGARGRRRDAGGARTRLPG